MKDVPLWKRLLNPVHLDNRAYLMLIGIGVGIYIPVQYLLKPWGEKLRAQEKQRHEVVAKTFKESEADETGQKHVFKFKKEPSLGIK
eukprot:CAMPEP_0204919878 /NCGR_PEP_ID=MMETSP1397-20131031/17065_1 /ASSEMBLY_ACC=CAM_ASM_000891 /TAXON_ID=49980 /ORGANISM="Climacostomum Climacostomum virens, Strain Stock W-24" /LENGTH=86 /DNA_ID=CAMNT_0052093509 /DNA_START=223 /DNA_END=483 /DNA_ORIENTATION=+